MQTSHCAASFSQAIYFSFDAVLCSPKPSYESEASLNICEANSAAHCDSVILPRRSPMPTMNSLKARQQCDCVPASAQVACHHLHVSRQQSNLFVHLLANRLRKLGALQDLASRHVPLNTTSRVHGLEHLFEQAHERRQEQRQEFHCSVPKGADHKTAQRSMHP